MSKLVLVYDDDGQYADSIRDSLKKVKPLAGVFNVQTLGEDEFRTALEKLNERAIKMRNDEQVPLKGTLIDNADIFIVDYDLIASKAGEFLTGEAVAYVARCFSGCGLIVGLNQYGHNTFDLTLKGHPESFADLNLGQDQIDNPNLWGGSKSGFHPWHWPNLPGFLTDFEERVDDVRTSLADEIPICQVMDVPPEVFGTLPKSIGQFLGRKPEETTFGKFVSKSGNCLRPKDEETACEDVIARVGAARISKWLERLVLPGQNILVDAPHLIARYPSLLVGDSPTIHDWNATADYSNEDKCELISSEVEKYRLNKNHWVSRPVWRWSELSEDEGIPEISEPWDATPAPCTFCEDASRFYSKRACRAFLAETDSPFARRYVKVFGNVDYRPQVRFSL